MAGNLRLLQSLDLNMEDSHTGPPHAGTSRAVKVPHSLLFPQCRGQGAHAGDKGVGGGSSQTHLPEPGWEGGVVDAERGVKQLILKVCLRPLHSTSVLSSRPCMILTLQASACAAPVAAWAMLYLMQCTGLHEHGAA